MRKIISCITLFTFISTIVLNEVALAQAQPAPEKIKIAVIDLKAKRGIDEMTVSSLTDLICTEIASLGKYSVIGRDDMQAMLEHIADKQLLECDDTKCLAQVGGALGVQQLLSGNIGMIGTTYLINLKLIDIDNVVVMNRVSEEYKGDEAGLIGKIKQTVGMLFGEKKPETAAPAPVVQEKPKPPAPELQPVQAAKVEKTEKPEQAEKTEKVEKKSGFPWLWVGLGAVVVGGGAAAAIMLGGKKSENGGSNGSSSDLPLPPGMPTSSKRTIKIIFNF